MSSPCLLRPVAIAAALLVTGLVAAPSARAQAVVAVAQPIDIPAQPAQEALRRFVELTRFQLVYDAEIVRGVTSKPVTGTMTPREALARMLEGTGVQVVDAGSGATLRRPLEAAATDGEGAVASLQRVTVTARKASERMLDVPIAITALTGDNLRRRGASSVADVLQDAPGVAALPSNAGLTQIAIRGIATSLGGNNASSVSQAAALAALQAEPTFLRGWIEIYKQRRDRGLELLNAIPGLSCRTPGGAFYLYVNCQGLIGKQTPDGKTLASDLDLVLYLLDSEGVAVVAGSSYGSSPYFRISIATAVEIIERGCERIRVAIERLR